MAGGIKLTNELAWVGCLYGTIGQTVLDGQVTSSGVSNEAACVAVDIDDFAVEQAVGDVDVGSGVVIGKSDEAAIVAACVLGIKCAGVDATVNVYSRGIGLCSQDTAMP